MDIRKTQVLRNLLKDKSLLKEKCYIDGKWVGGSATIDVTNPVDESVIGTVPKHYCSRLRLGRQSGD